MRDDGSTIIDYQGARAAAEEIYNMSKTMEAIFDSFGDQMKTVGADDVYQGNASETLGQRFSSLKQKFVSYQELIKNFADTFRAATDQTESMENRLDSKAQDLAA
jgi:uncharacterized protein YukE